jgi:uncharacterized repeat protein (TIGR04138 family)
MADTPVIQPRSLEQIVQEVGAYSLEAFQFVRDALGVASERVHGCVSKQERRILRWMARENLTLEAVRRLYDEDRLPPNVRAAVDRLGGIDALNRHVTGQQLCLALRDLAVERWGLLARVVLTHWGICNTSDFGRIVFALVDNQLLSKQPTDSIQDFDRVYDFREAFDRRYRITLEKAG